MVIVDDGSPVSAADEINGLTGIDSVYVRVIKQENAGCFPACNMALDSVDASTDYIAFLDSDDEWTDNHLQNAIWALDAGHDLYFSDFYQLNQTVSAFQRDGRLDVEAHGQIDPDKPIYAFAGSLFDQIIRANLLGTSTIVYARKALGDLRYLKDYRHTGPEYILWLNMALRTNRVAFSIEPECRYGGGVNIFSESAWGTEKFLTVRQEEIRWRKYVLAHMPLTDSQRMHLQGKIRDSRLSFCLGLLHNVRSGVLSMSVVRRQLALDPMTFPTLVAAPLVAGARKVRSLIQN
jgi:succinoglycan biosynthesis protein ExoW